MSKLTEFVSIARKIDNVELHNKLIELSEEYYKLKEENLELKEKIKILNEKEKMVFERNVYWKENKDGPYCPRCLDVESISVRLNKINEDYYTCENCKAGYSLSSKEFF